MNATLVGLAAFQVKPRERRKTKDSFDIGLANVRCAPPCLHLDLSFIVWHGNECVFASRTVALAEAVAVAVEAALVARIVSVLPLERKAQKAENCKRRSVSLADAPFLCEYVSFSSLAVFMAEGVGLLFSPKC